MEDNHMNESVKNQTNIEPLMNRENFRYTIKPINPEYQIFWNLYKKQQECYWTAEEIDFSNDYNDYLLLDEHEQHFIKCVLAFFAASDGIVNLNLRERFSREIMITEAQIAYSWQMMMENVHGEVYSDMLLNIIKDEKERNHLFNAIKEIKPIKDMADWALKWIESDKSYGYRVIAFAIVEGIFFSGAFAAIFWLKYKRGTEKLLMPGLVLSNEFISRDERMHTEFACVAYSFIKNRVPESDVVEMMKEAVQISQTFTDDALQCKLIGMNAEQMAQYIQYVADRLMMTLSYNKIYGVDNPFPFMEAIGVYNKTEFFSHRPTTYQKAHNQKNKADKKFEILEDF